MNEHETHEEVIKLARRELEDHERINCWFRPEFVRALIDRLEAAHKRDRGDCAKLREAVKAVVEVGYPHNFQHEAPHISGYCYDITRAIDKCFAALDTTSNQNTQEDT